MPKRRLESNYSTKASNDPFDQEQIKKSRPNQYIPQKLTEDDQKSIAIGLAKHQKTPIRPRRMSLDGSFEKSNRMVENSETDKNQINTSKLKLLTCDDLACVAKALKESEKGDQTKIKRSKLKRLTFGELSYVAKALEASEKKDRTKIKRSHSFNFSDYNSQRNISDLYKGLGIEENKDLAKRNGLRFLDFSNYGSRKNISLKETWEKSNGIVPGAIIMERERHLPKTQKTKYSKIIGESARNGNKYMIKMNQVNCATHINDDDFANYFIRDNMHITQPMMAKIKFILEHKKNITSKAQNTSSASNSNRSNLKNASTSGVQSASGKNNTQTNSPEDQEILNRINHQIRNILYPELFYIAWKIMEDSVNIGSSLEKLISSKYKKLSKLGKFNVTEADVVKTTFEDILCQKQFGCAVVNGEKIKREPYNFPFPDTLRRIVNFCIKKLFDEEIKTKGANIDTEPVVRSLAFKIKSDMESILKFDKMENIADLTTRNIVIKNCATYRQQEIFVLRSKWIEKLGSIWKFAEFKEENVFSVFEKDIRGWPELFAAHILLGNSDNMFNITNNGIVDNNWVTSMDYEKSCRYGMLYSEKVMNERIKPLFENFLPFTQKMIQALNKYVEEINKPGSEYFDILSSQAKCRFNKFIDICINPLIVKANINLEQKNSPKHERFQMVLKIHEPTYIYKPIDPTQATEIMARFNKEEMRMDNQTFSEIIKEYTKLKKSAKKYQLNPTDPETQKLMSALNTRHTKIVEDHAKLKNNESNVLEKNTSISNADQKGSPQTNVDQKRSPQDKSFLKL